MTEVAIRVENLSKRYRIGQRESYKTLRDTLADAIYAPFRTLATAVRRRPTGASFSDSSLPSAVDGRDTFIWALKDVSFEIKRGEVLGVVGRNGAGKSTLLRILSRITEPTEGSAEIHGRVGSLLEVGTGFHPELTGGENIFLNGAILGMKKAEIERKFDEIAAFAEIERFINTPVKHYSSGMYVRLAFAVAAHLDPEILLVDEVLAVGDAAFQRKCLGKMGNVAKEGRTVLFVSHNMGAVNRLCPSAIWIDQGRLAMTGPAESVVTSYLCAGAAAEGERTWHDISQAPGNDKLRLQRVRVLNADRKVIDTVDIRQPFYVEIEYQVLQLLSNVRIALRLIAGDGTVVFTSTDNSDGLWDLKPRSAGSYVSRCEIPGNFLNEGLYSLTVSADIPFVDVLFFEEHVLSFQVVQSGGVSGRFPERWPGVICPKLLWRVEVSERRH